MILFSHVFFTVSSHIITKLSEHLANRVSNRLAVFILVFGFYFYWIILYTFTSLLIKNSTKKDCHNFSTKPVLFLFSHSHRKEKDFILGPFMINIFAPLLVILTLCNFIFIKLQGFIFSLWTFLVHKLSLKRELWWCFCWKLSSSIRLPQSYTRFAWCSLSDYLDPLTQFSLEWLSRICQ